MTPSWELSILRSIKLIRKRLFRYIKSNNFHKEWNTFNFIRSDVKWLLVCDSFVYNNYHTKLIAEVMYSTMVSQLILTRRLHVTNIPFELIVNSVVNSFRGVIYRDLLRIYKNLWHHAEYIQIRWRRAISDPSYKLCRDRLTREWSENCLG